MTHEEIMARQRRIRRANGNAWTKKYEKSPNGFLMRLYRNMQSRVMGIQKQKYHLYKGKYLLPREEFKEWALNSPKFWIMFDIWEWKKYDRKLTPTVNRIDPTKGYEATNMEWLTHSENSRLGSIGAHRK
jgi:hypothetical protein